MHGGRAPQVRAKAAERVALAEELERNPRRHPAQILADTLHTADVMLRRTITTYGEESTPAQLDALVAVLERAQRFAQQVMTLRVDVRPSELLTPEFVEQAIRDLEDEIAARGLPVPPRRLAIDAEVVDVDLDDEDDDEPRWPT